MLLNAEKNSREVRTLVLAHAHTRSEILQPRWSTYLIQGMDLNVFCPNVSQISLCVVFQVIRHTEPGGKVQYLIAVGRPRRPNTLKPAERNSAVTIFVPFPRNG